MSLTVFLADIWTCIKLKIQLIYSSLSKLQLKCNNDWNTFNRKEYTTFTPTGGFSPTCGIKQHNPVNREGEQFHIDICSILSAKCQLSI